MKHRENQQQSKHVCDIVGNERKKKKKKDGTIRSKTRELTEILRDRLRTFSCASSLRLPTLVLSLVETAAQDAEKLRRKENW